MSAVTIKHRYTGAVLFRFEATEDQQASGMAIRCALEAATLSSADLSFANLSFANLSSANLRFANLSFADLSFADLSSADLRFANLRSADLSSADLSFANLSSANLRSADLRFADLSFANLSSANLRSANLRSANLSSAELSDSKLTGSSPVFQIGPIGSRADTLVVFGTDKGLMFRAGCFFGSRDEFIAAVEKTHGESNHAIQYRAAIAMADGHFAMWADEAQA